MGESSEDGSAVGDSVSGCERIVTRGTKEFQLGQVDVSVSAAHTWVEGAGMKVELPMWRVALAASMVGVERVELVGSERGDMVNYKLMKGVVMKV